MPKVADIFFRKPKLIIVKVYQNQNHGDFMKVLLISLLTLGSISSFADCKIDLRNLDSIKITNGYFFSYPKPYKKTPRTNITLEAQIYALIQLNLPNSNISSYDVATIGIDFESFEENTGRKNVYGEELKQKMGRIRIWKEGEVIHQTTKLPYEWGINFNTKLDTEILSALLNAGCS